MKILLDESFPLRLLRNLHADGHSAEHVITIGWRGASDDRIRERLDEDRLVFLTQDEDFLFGAPVSAVIVVSRVRQSRLLADRIAIWRKAIDELAQATRTERRFELTDDGRLIPWREASTSSRSEAS